METTNRIRLLGKKEYFKLLTKTPQRSTNIIRKGITDSRNCTVLMKTVNSTTSIWGDRFLGSFLN